MRIVMSHYWQGIFGLDASDDSVIYSSVQRTGGRSRRMAEVGQQREESHERRRRHGVWPLPSPAPHRPLIRPILRAL